ncbi:hypothetical protein [Sorangium sp. So ce1335]|uniref:hypothetical protein n=1 Tax=Sorangium sp. So ce1335 TaxID=3133335 RepID=UPI003F643F4E
MNTPRHARALGRSLLLTAAFLALGACRVTGSIDGAAAGDQGGGGGGASPKDEHGVQGSDEGDQAGQGGGDEEAGTVACVDECPANGGGITVGCKKRFLFGMNYAWHNFAGDFGGIAAWDKRGVTAEADTHARNLADMRAHGASVARWWMLPEIRGESVVFDANGDPAGLGETTRSDVQKALELADQADINLMFCLFSFDNFHPGRVDGDVKTVGLTPLVTDAARRAALIENVVRPIAQAVEQSPYRHRMVAWDVINEPELAITGQSPYGDPEYTPDPSVEPIAHEQMEAFLRDTIQALRAESQALITIGSASMKWKKAWSTTDIDFYTFHMNDRVNRYWPYNQSPRDYGITDKPVVMSDFPTAGLATADVSKLLESWYSQGYAGAISWAYTDAVPGELASMKAFVDGKGCDVRY